MTIRLQTARGTNIPNAQDSEISSFDRNWAEKLPEKYRNADFRTGLSPKYNCHGLTFASRRTKVYDAGFISVILSDDQYLEIQREQEVKAGDIVVYYGDDGDPTHSGIVVSNSPPPLHVPLVLSKWGSGPEVIHRLHDVPPVYGANHRFFRCQL